MGKKRQSNRKHSDEFRREAVRLMEERGEHTISDVAKSIRVRPGQLYEWRKNYAAQPRPAGME
ncbi:MAG: transposase, partial [Myxococcales bacterium]|nr:transposase [Myxococcales bacterium]